jgi:tRNA nucleotidyltransferase (CCA-adding enzyme)
LKLKYNPEGLDKSGLKPSEIYARLSRYSKAAIQVHALCSSSLHVRRNLKLFLDKLATEKTYLNGKDLMQMGMPEGRKVGLILARLLAARIDGEVRTRADEMRLARKLING